MSDLNTPMFSFKQYINDKQQLTQAGTVDAGIQAKSPRSAGARGLQKTHSFTKEPVHMMGESITMEDIKVLITKIDVLQSIKD